MLAIPLIVIVIFVVVWIISNVVRAQQDAAQAAARRNAARRPGASPPEKTTSSDIDRFLQEIDRLRKKDGAPAASKPAAEETQRSRSQQQKRSQPRPKPPERRPAPLPPTTPLPPVRSSTAPLVPEVVAEPQRRVAPMSATPVELKYPDVQAVVRPSTPSRPSRPAQAATPASAALELVQTLFKSRQGAAVAILVSEILGKPKCRQ